jgi:hypothetical protein
LVNFAIDDTDLLQRADFYAFFALLMLVTTGLFAMLSPYFPEHSRLQTEATVVPVNLG